ncbi:MAG: PEP-CTERM sorting domain-containing protein [Verrucomicrobiales bacterium]|nr:PEP-CTERM sorting domain-containing protein [Verrucomicrobiales bacterium]
MLKLRLLGLAAASLWTAQTHATDFAQSVVAYTPGIGFATDFNTGAGYTNIFAALGEPSRVTPGQFGGPVDPFSPPYLQQQLLSVGTGGSVTFAFGTPIHNSPNNAFGIDFIVFGNSGFTITNGDFAGGGITDGSLFGANSGATRVSVSSDNISWFQLDPTKAPTVDGLFPTDGLGDFSRPMNPMLTGASFSGNSLAGIRGLYAGSGGGTGFDLSWAQDEQGRSANISIANYVRIDVVSGVSEIDGVAIVPEPSTWALLLLGLILLFSRHWRRASFMNRTADGPRPQHVPTAMGLGKFSQPARSCQAALALALCLAATVRSPGASLEENFADDPRTDGWRIFGDSSLFQWNELEQQLAVTWDSTRPNSYFYRPLPAALSKSDDFALAFDLTLADVEVGVTPGKPFTFQVALGFLNFADATQTNFLRGAGVNPATGPRNIVEFDYFPDSGFGATVAPTVISTDNQFASSFTFPLELTPGARFHVSMRYTAAGQTLRTAMTRDGEPFGPVKEVTLPASFSDFRVDTVSITSFTDTGADGSIRARGIVDNLAAELPEPPVTRISGAFVGQGWQVSFATRSNWVYTLEASDELRQWTSASASLAGTGLGLTLTDNGAAQPTMPGREAGLTRQPRQRFYRVRAERP